MTDARSKRGYLSATHPLAAVAREHCDAHGVPTATRLGRVACGKCWELAIRDDERAVVVFGLPRELVPDPAYVDEIAVERVLSGERITLTAAEKRAAAAELARRRATVSEIAERLEMKNSTVRGLLDAIDAAVDLDGDKPKRRLRADPTTFAPRATTAPADTDPTGEAA